MIVKKVTVNCSFNIRTHRDASVAWSFKAQLQYGGQQVC